MPPRRRATPVTPIDVEEVRRKLGEGKIVRVGISNSAQFPEGGTGRVRQIGDPAVDGEEFIQVEVNLNGTKDVLPFTPADLTPATRTRTLAAAPSPVTRAATPRTPSSRQTAAGPRVAKSVAKSLANSGEERAAAGAVGRPPAERRTGELTSARQPALLAEPADATSGTPGLFNPNASTVGPGAAGPSAAGPSAAGPSAAGPSAAGPSEAGPSAAGPSEAGPSAAGPSAAGPSGGAKAKSARGPRKSPAVSITIATSETDPTHWKIEAKVGAKLVVRAGSVSGARVWELVRMLEDETLTRAVGGILDEQRKATQARADALASELARVQAELEELPG